MSEFAERDIQVLQLSDLFLSELIRIFELPSDFKFIGITIELPQNIKNSYNKYKELEIAIEKSKALRKEFEINSKKEYPGFSINDEWEFEILKKNFNYDFSSINQDNFTKGITTEKLNEDAKRLFEAARSKGFYDQYPTPEHRQEQSFIDQKLNLIVTEIGEAYESYRAGKIDATEEQLNKLWNEREELIKINMFSETYNTMVKGTVAEELADVYIRTCDLAGATNSELIYSSVIELNEGIEALFRILTIHTVIPSESTMGWRLSEIIVITNSIAKYFNIDLEKHIELKACRNREREYMHGKRF